MSIAIGGNSVSKMYVGSTEITKAYIGDTLVYGGGQPSIPNYLRFKALEASTIGCTLVGNSMVMPNMEYSTDLVTWSTFTNETTISLSANDVVYFRGVNNSLGKSGSAYMKFVMTGAIEAHGNVMSLLYGDNFEGQTTCSEYAFCRLFNDCLSLKTPPELPATTVQRSSYFHMFNGSGITYAPDLPVTSVNGTQPFGSMFYHCYDMIKAPKILPATTLPNVSNSSTYGYMFNGCPITEAPELPAQTLVQRCYMSMFFNCSSLNYIKMLATNISASNCLSNWVSGVAATGIFVKNINATWTTTGASGVPTGWTVIYYNPTTDKYYLSDKTTECDDHGNVI